jgi:two-component system, OmpR family, heavy metal sensor histidine kinase CusS
MMLRSFRLKIGILSVCLSGCILLAFGLFFIVVIEQVSRERVDRELRALAEEQVRRPAPPEHWTHFDDSLQTLYKAGGEKQFVIKVTDTQGDSLYVSPQWPAETIHVPWPSMPVREEVVADRPRLPPPDWPVRPEERGEPRFEPSSMRPPPPLTMRLRGPVYITVRATQTYWRIIAMGNERITLNIGVNLSAARADARRFRAAFLAASVFALVLLIGGAWLLAQVALRPVQVVARTAETITARQLDQRIPDMDADEEFRHLIVVINSMLDRLERSFRQAVRFGADAAHELKTPLTILQGELEQALQRAPDGSVEQRTYTDLLDEVQRLKGIVRKLLLLAQADSGQMQLARQRLKLGEIVQAVCEDLGILAPHVKLTAEMDPDVWVMGDADLLNQVLQNLASNAAKFNDERNIIAMTLRRTERGAVFSISNTGPGIPLADSDKMFERFYRADKSRSRQIDGAGLGLSLSREIARAHGGDLILERSDEHMTIFTLTLPLAEEGEKAGLPQRSKA